MNSKNIIKNIRYAMSLGVVLISCNVLAVTSNPNPGMDGDPNLRTEIYEAIENEVTTKYVTIDPKEEKTVRIFFDFRCQFCKSSHEFVKNWASTLPAEYRVEYQHVLTGDKTSVILASAYQFALENMTPPNYYLFMDTIYAHIHKTRTAANVTRLVKEALVNSGVKMQDYRDYMDKIHENIARLEAQRLRQEEYAVDRTPTIVVGAKYLTNLDYAAGDPTKFINLLNVVVNMSILKFE